jgi:hypothetical protein
MYTSLVSVDQMAAYGAKEFGPIILALAFVIAIGGVTAATILICGWRGAKSVGVNWAQKRVEIVCR